MKRKKVTSNKPTQGEITYELQRIYIEHKALKPTIVVAEATPEESLLHPSFEWNNSVAGHEYRLIQARQLIRVVVPMIEVAGKAVPDRFVHVPAANPSVEREGEYHPVSVIKIMPPDAYARAFSEAAKHVRAAQSKLEDLRFAESEGDEDADRKARIAMAITALQTAGAAVSALH